MRIVGCGLIAVATLLGVAPTALASEPAGHSAEAQTSTSSAGRQAAKRQAEPHSEVSLLAVVLTAGAAAAAAGSGAVQAVHRRRAPQRNSSQPTQDTAAVRIHQAGTPPSH